MTTSYNTVVKDYKECAAIGDDMKAALPATAKYVKHNDCADGKIALLTFSDDKCTTSVTLTEAQKTKGTLATLGTCTKMEEKVGDKQYWMIVTGARDLTAAVAAASLAVAAALY